MQIGSSQPLSQSYDTVFPCVSILHTFKAFRELLEKRPNRLSLSRKRLKMKLKSPLVVLPCCYRHDIDKFVSIAVCCSDWFSLQRQLTIDNFCTNFAAHKKHWRPWMVRFALSCFQQLRMQSWCTTKNCLILCLYLQSNQSHAIFFTRADLRMYRGNGFSVTVWSPVSKWNGLNRLMST